MFFSRALFHSAHGFADCHKNQIKLHLFCRDSKVISPRAIFVMSNSVFNLTVSTVDESQR